MSNDDHFIVQRGTSTMMGALNDIFILKWNELQHGGPNRKGVVQNFFLNRQTN